LTREDDTLQLPVVEEEEMAVIPCANPECGVQHRIINEADHRHFNDIIRGVFYCGYCEQATAFQIKGNAANFLPGRLFQEELADDVAEEPRAMFAEALLCFYGASYSGVIAMCRSAIAEAILAKGIGNRKKPLPDLIELAKNAGLVDTLDESTAESVRVLGRDTLHYMRAMTPTEGAVALGAIAKVLNNITKRTPPPA